MGEVKTAPVAAVLVDEAAFAPAGAIAFYEDRASGEIAGFHFQCPCGCGLMGGVRLIGSQAWRWNAFRDKPTVSPSVLLYGADGRPHWHGWLRNGVWESC